MWLIPFSSIFDMPFKWGRLQREWNPIGQLNALLKFSKTSRFLPIFRFFQIAKSFEFFESSLCFLSFAVFFSIFPSFIVISRVDDDHLLSYLLRLLSFANLTRQPRPVGHMWDLKQRLFSFSIDLYFVVIVAFDQVGLFRFSQFLNIPDY